MKDTLTGPQKNLLLGFARHTISCRFNQGEDFPDISKKIVFRQKSATFVTLKIAEKLRGCIGQLEPVSSLWESVRDNALSAAFHDYRFPPLKQRELEKVRLDISILSSPALLEYTDSDDLVKKLQPGVDGVILSDGCRGATFLPQVWRQLPTPELFLGELCRKAGLEKNAWLEGILKIKVYTVCCFGEGEI